ncbi:ATP-binding cassette domain-containing protein [Calothrix sp. PCC 6303]|uniref:ABC transporter ATP-binding protein n=1 Tax=Calothrix sp. PCC 6303 TaxID=1170562 RepID=UPI0002A0360D|nr:ATP-binding cassette domain-containing protein [Calothrix sp. PCC 6303]AFZ00934.1 Phosphonate-transporting ATPase [Calothrix sp. PCC 6303]
MALLKLENVSLSTQLQQKTQKRGISLPGYRILEDISFEVAAGDRIIVTGATGAGKTFLLRLLNRLSEPTSGKIFFQNQDYTQIPVIQLRQQIVMVNQEVRLLGMTVKDALAYPLKLRGLAKAEIQQRIAFWVEQLQIPDGWLERNEVQLSLGQKQLVAIARAIITQPLILLLDEPTSALDVGTSKQIIEILSQQTQTTIITATHQFELFQQSCDCLLYLANGRLISNQPANQVDWVDLKAKITQAETEDDF